MGGKCDNKQGNLNWVDPLPRISWYKNGSDITKGDITEVRVYSEVKQLPGQMAYA